jgi:hypothetical protein
MPAEKVCIGEPSIHFRVVNPNTEARLCPRIIISKHWNRLISKQKSARESSERGEVCLHSHFIHTRLEPGKGYLHH